MLYDKWNRYNHFNTGVFDNEKSSDSFFPVCYVNNKANLESAFEYLKKKTKTVKKEDIDVNRYRYRQDFYYNFKQFVDQSLSE